jgi:hypothetical protein
MCCSHRRRRYRGELDTPIAPSRQRSGDFDRLLAIQTDECIEWPHARTSAGYGTLVYEGTKHYTHRLALQRATGIDGDGLEAAHGPCHNPSCMNPRHLRWATRAENCADKKRDGTMNWGEQCPAHRLTERDVRVIRASGEQGKVLAEKYGVGEATISQARNRRTWKHI